MAESFYFYDLETTGVNSREDRIIQFAGQRTSLDIKPKGEPDNILINLSDDILPSPDATLVTGIVPQKTRADGVSESEFLKYFHEKILNPNMIFVGYNNIRFDDEFMRFINYRNFYDAYEWQWKDGCSRWDMLDVTRMARALRPEGIDWPLDSEGKPTNRLEFLSAINNLDHIEKHDALSDVKALIALTDLIRNKQPKLFSYLLTMRDKKKVKELVEKGEPFVYSSGKYPSEYEKTTVANIIGPHPDNLGALVYDLRHDPTEFLTMLSEELADCWVYMKAENAPPRLPVKTLKYNRAPAVAPLGVLDKDSVTRLKFDLNKIKQYREKLLADPDFINRLSRALEIMNERRQAELITDGSNVDSALYEGFFDKADVPKMRAVRAAEPDELSDISFDDERLNQLLPLYKARNFPKYLSSEEKNEWNKFRRNKLLDGGENSKMAKYFKRIEELANESTISDKQKYLLEELQLWGENIALDLNT